MSTVAVGLTDFTFPDSGVTVSIKRLSPILLNDIRKAIRREAPKPKPPMHNVNYGGNIKEEENPNDPAYLEALTEYNALVGELFVDRLIRYGVECQVDAEAVRELRESAPDLELPDNDKVLYVSRICIQTNADLTALQEAILARSQPTEAAIGGAAEKFRR